MLEVELTPLIDFVLAAYTRCAVAGRLSHYTVFQYNGELTGGTAGFMLCRSLVSILLYMAV